MKKRLDECWNRQKVIIDGKYYRVIDPSGTSNSDGILIKELKENGAMIRHDGAAIVETKGIVL